MPLCVAPAQPCSAGHRSSVNVVLFAFVPGGKAAAVRHQKALDRALHPHQAVPVADAQAGPGGKPGKPFEPGRRKLPLDQREGPVGRDTPVNGRRIRSWRHAIYPYHSSSSTPKVPDISGAAESAPRGLYTDHSIGIAGRVKRVGTSRNCGECDARRCAAGCALAGAYRSTHGLPTMFHTSGIHPIDPALCSRTFRCIVRPTPGDRPKQA